MFDYDVDIKMLPALMSIEPEKVFALPDRSLADDDFKLMATLSDLADRELVATIGWAKQVPGKPSSLLIQMLWHAVDVTSDYVVHSCFYNAFLDRESAYLFNAEEKMSAQY